MINKNLLFATLLCSTVAFASSSFVMPNKQLTQEEVTELNTNNTVVSHFEIQELKNKFLELNNRNYILQKEKEALENKVTSMESDLNIMRLKIDAMFNGLTKKQPITNKKRRLDSESLKLLQESLGNQDN
jgi:predicted  nucleic acid-binding Zn-ribbon protein